jgi:hypothetical protein
MKSTLLLMTLLIISTLACKNKATTSQLDTQTYKIKPSETDAAISKFNDKHAVLLNTKAPSKAKLLVFLPGTGATLKHYSKILNEAADMGYHVVGLMYPNKSEIYLNCFFNKDSTCYEQFRSEKFDGTDNTKKLKVDYANSIQNRLIKILQYLNKQYPTQNWGQFLEGDDVFWSKCVIAGHSQGGGHAAYIGKIKAVDRVVIFSSIDWIIASKMNAAWVSKTGKTPNDRVYAFIHTKDEYFKYPNVQKQWQDYALDTLGGAVNIDIEKPPFNNSHTLITKARPTINILMPHHCFTCVNEFVPQNKKGEVDPAFKDVWAYLLGKND